MTMFRHRAMSPVMDFIFFLSTVFARLFPSAWSVSSSACHQSRSVVRKRIVVDLLRPINRGLLASRRMKSHRDRHRFLSSARQHLNMSRAFGIWQPTYGSPLSLFYEIGGSMCIRVRYCLPGLPGHGGCFPNPAHSLVGGTFLMLITTLSLPSDPAANLTYSADP